MASGKLIKAWTGLVIIYVSPLSFNVLLKTYDAIRHVGIDQFSRKSDLKTRFPNN